MATHKQFSVTHAEQTATGLLSVFLREPRQHIDRLQSRHDRLQARLEYNRHHPQTDSHLKRHILRFHFPQKVDYEKLLAVDSRSRILASFHFGDYVYGMHFLANNIEHPGPLKVLSQQPGSSIYRANIHAAFGVDSANEGAELLSDRQDVAALSAFLRQQQSTLILFCDLPSGCGERVCVNFLQRSAWFPRGPATLAVINRVPILPVITVAQGQKHYLILYPQLETAAQPEESLPDCIARITQCLVAILETHFRDSPEAWRYLRLLPAYFMDVKNPVGIAYGQIQGIETV